MTKVQEKGRDYKHGIEVVKVKQIKKVQFYFVSIITRGNTLLSFVLFLDFTGNI